MPAALTASRWWRRPRTAAAAGRGRAGAEPAGERRRGGWVRGATCKAASYTRCLLASKRTTHLRHDQSDQIAPESEGSCRFQLRQRHETVFSRCEQTFSSLHCIHIYSSALKKLGSTTRRRHLAAPPWLAEGACPRPEVRQRARAPNNTPEIRSLPQLQVARERAAAAALAAAAAAAAARNAANTRAPAVFVWRRHAGPQ